jgi:hypothetical protein
MIELGTASEDDVVLAFLRAEIDSPKWEPNYSHALRELKLDRVSLVDAADLEDARVCSARKDLLGVVRGYGRNVALFEGFPKDTTWRRVKVEQPDFQRLKCISKDERWSKLTGGTRLIREAARNFEDYPELGRNRARRQSGMSTTLEIVRRPGLRPAAGTGRHEAAVHRPQRPQVPYCVLQVR